MAFNIQKAKEIQRKNPNKKWTQCVKEAGCIGAVKKKPAKVGAVKKKPVKVGAIYKISGIPVKKKIGSKPQGALSGLKKHLAVVDEINKMERQYRSTSDPLKKQVIAMAINKEHDKLDRIFKK